MKITLENIGKINKAEVEINGITVIAGENDTGKSTVGKALYGVFNALYNIDKKVQDEIKEKFDQIVRDAAEEYYISSFFEENDFRVEHEKFTFVLKSAEKIYKDYISIPNFLNVFTREMLSQYMASSEHDIDIQVIEYLYENLGKLFSIPKNKIVNHIIEGSLNSEFNNRIGNIYEEEYSCGIKINVRNADVEVKVRENEVIEVLNPFAFKIPILYIDSPFVLDHLGKRAVRRKALKDHNEHLQEKLYVSENTGVIDEILTKKSLENIYKKIDFVCSGELVNSASGRVEYQFKDGEKKLSPRSLSTGLKSFVILKTLLKNGSLKENGTVILDEPEVHLHPKWQLLFAEIIVLLHKELGIHILLNTHSPYFLEAIEVYSSKHGVEGKCKYYLSQEKENQFWIEDVTDDIERIYEKLAYPFQVLENERYSDG